MVAASCYRGVQNPAYSDRFHHFELEFGIIINFFPVFRSVLTENCVYREELNRLYGEICCVE